jgi:hypothetical protein
VIEDEKQSRKFDGPIPTNETALAERERNRNNYLAESMQKRIAFEAEWSAKFTTTYYGRLTAIRDQLASLGLESKTLNDHIANQFFTSAFWSQRLTMEIERLANQIKE